MDIDVVGKIEKNEPAFHHQPDDAKLNKERNIGPHGAKQAQKP